MQDHINNIICLKIGKNRVFLNKKQIIMFRIIERKIEVITDSNSYYISGSLLDIENKLKNKDFFRVSQSCIVNVKRIEKIETSKKIKYIKFTDFNEKAVISPGKMQELLSVIITI